MKEILLAPSPGEPVRPHTLYEFEKITGMEYITELKFQTPKLRKKIEKLVAKAPVSERAQRLGSMWSPFIQEGYVAPLYLNWVNEKVGWGAFARVPFEKGLYVGEYTGLVRPVTMFTSDLNEYCFRYPLYNLWWKHYTIDPKKHGNEMSFINHSSEPNLEATAVLQDGIFHICLRAIDDIAPDEELTFDYGTEAWINT